MVENFQTGSLPVKTSEAGYGGLLDTVGFKPGDEAGTETRGLNSERMNNRERAVGRRLAVAQRDMWWATRRQQ